jgi:hypothetical protein
MMAVCLLACSGQWAGCLGACGNADNQPMTFETARRQIMESGEPSSGDDLLGMQMDFDVYLFECPGLATVKVTKTGSPDALLEARCVAHRGASADAIEEQIVHAWREDLCYGYREAHQVRRRNDTVQLDFVTQICDRGLYVTGAITVRWP